MEGQLRSIRAAIQASSVCGGGDIECACMLAATRQASTIAFASVEFAAQPSRCSCIVTESAQMLRVSELARLSHLLGQSSADSRLIGGQIRQERGRFIGRQRIMEGGQEGHERVPC
jgi:hypothetical protein